MPKRGEFPTRENCSPDDPEEFALWAFAALPGVRGAPLIMPTDYYRQISKRLWDLGFRHVEEPALEWVAPTANEPHWMTSPGRWVPAGSVPRLSEEEEAKRSVAKMKLQQKAELRLALEEWDKGNPMPDTPAGRVAGGLTYHQRDVVLKILREEHRNDPA